MSENRIHIDDLYREELGGYTEAPPAAVWQSLSERLDEHRPKAATPFRWLWWVAAFVAALVAMYLLLQKMQHSKVAAPRTTVINESSTATTAVVATANTLPEMPEQPAGADSVTHEPALAKVEETTGTTTGVTTAIAKAPDAASQKTSGSSATSNFARDAVISSDTVKGNTTQSSTVKASAAGYEPAAAKQAGQNARHKGSKRTQSVLNIPAMQGAEQDNTTLQPKAKSKQNITNAISEPAKITIAAKQEQKKTIAAPAIARTTQQTTNAASAMMVQNTVISASATAAPQATTAYVPHDPRTDANTQIQATNANGSLSSLQQISLANARKDNYVPNDERKRKSFKLKLDYGVKAGYDAGFGTYHANGFVFSPYITWKVSDKLSVLVQPGVKYAKLNKTSIDDAAVSYYNITGSKLDSAHERVQLGLDSFAQPYYGTRRRYYYSQTHDSVVIATEIKTKTYYQYEIPLMLQYHVAKQLGIYAGVSANFSKVVIEKAEVRQTYGNITLNDSLLFAVVPDSISAPSIPSVNSRFSYNTTPYSQYNAGTTLQNPTGNPVRFSYVAGINYEVWRRLMVDMMVHGMLSSPTYIPDSRIKSIYKQPYIRIMIGYRLGK